MWKRLYITALFVAVAAGGCASPTGVGDYFADRGRDFADVFRLSLTGGVGVHARARVLFMCASEGFAWGHSVGWDGGAGATPPHWNKLAAGFTVPFIFDYDVDVRGMDPGTPWSPFLTYYLGRDRGRDFAAEVADMTGGVFVVGYRMRYFRDPPPKGNRVADEYGWVEADAMAGLVGARVGVNLIELVDFVGGLLMLDLLNDDPRNDDPAPPARAAPTV